jgi:hypothetical protein
MFYLYDPSFLTRQTGQKLSESGGLKSFHDVYETPIGIVLFAPSKSSIYAMLFPPSDKTVLFFVFGSGSMYAYSPVREIDDISLVEKILSRAFVTTGRSACVLKSSPYMVLLKGSSPIRTLSLKVC